MSYESERPPHQRQPERISPTNPRELGEQLFAALSADEREARMVFAVFDEQTSAETIDALSAKKHAGESLRQAVIARLLLEQSVDQQTQLQLNEWRAELPPLPEFNS